MAPGEYETASDKINPRPTLTVRNHFSAAKCPLINHIGIFKVTETRLLDVTEQFFALYCIFM
jgi:hypothetical protein